MIGRTSSGEERGWQVKRSSCWSYLTEEVAERKNGGASTAWGEVINNEIVRLRKVHLFGVSLRVEEDV